MRHRVKKTILGRTKAPRNALLRNLATSLILYEKMKTTETKAKFVRPYVEKLITLGKKNDLHARRELLSKLYDGSAVKKVLENPSYEDKYKIIHLLVNKITQKSHLQYQLI